MKSIQLLALNLHYVFFPSTNIFTFLGFSFLSYSIRVHNLAGERSDLWTYIVT